MILQTKRLFHQVLLVLLLVMGLWFSVVPANAAINDQIHFQGKVVNADGTNVADDDYSFTFTIYDAATVGTNLWTETKTITVIDGIFATDLGSITDLPGSINFNSDSLYLGVDFDSDGEMEPRIRLTAVPYAFNAEKVNGLTVTETTGTLTIPDATTIAFSGANDVTFTSTGATTITLPTTGTLATLAGAETFSNKTIASGGLTVESTGWVGIGSGAGRITFTDSGTDLLTISDANVGIGTTTVPRLLTVNGAIRLYSTGTPGSPTLGDLYTNADGNLYFYNGSGWDDLTGGGAGVFTKTGTNLSPTTAGDDIYLASNELLGVGYDPSTLSAAVAAFSGNVGIGTSTADAKLSIISGDTTGALKLTANSVTTGDIMSINGSGLTTGSGLYINLASSHATAGTLIGSNIILSDTGVVTTGTDNTYGQLITVSRSGATGGTLRTFGSQITASDTNITTSNKTVYGILASASNRGATGGTQISYGGHFSSDGGGGTSTSYGVYALGGDASGASSTATNAYGVYGRARQFYTGSTSVYVGVYGEAGQSGNSLTLPDAFGGRFRVSGQDSGTITRGYGVYIDSAINSGGGTFTNNYGLYIDDQSAVGSTNSFNLFSAGSAAKNYFAGNVGIGTTTMPRQLTVAGAIRLNSTSTPSSPALGDLYTNADGNLYFYNGSGWDDLTSGGGGSSNWVKSGTNLSPLTAGDDLYLGSGELLGVGYNPSALSNAVAAFSGNVGIGTSTATSKLTVLSGDTTRALQVIGNSVTTGEVIDISANGLTTGYAMNLSSTSNNLSTGGLIDLDWTPSAVATASGDLFRINLGAHADITGNLFALYDSGSSIFLASTVKITSALPHEFTASGDVSIAYNIVMTNQTASEIQSYGPLTIRSGEAFENLDLTLDPSGIGGVVIADGSDLKMYADQKIILDVDDGSDSYIQFDNANNRVEIFADNSERFRFTASGQNESNGALTTTLSDVAENYPTMNDSLAPGDVVMVTDLGMDAPAAAVVDTADSDHRQNVLGVVSSKPGILLGGSSFLSDICEAVTASASGKLIQRESLLKTEYKQLKLLEFESVTQNSTDSAALQAELDSQIAADLLSMTLDELETVVPETTIKTVDDRINSCEAVKQVPVALAGRVPVKFDASQGAVRPGDLLSVSPSKPGFVSKAKTAGWVIGKALAPSTPDSETVMMFVNITWYGGGDSISALNQVLGTSSDVSLSPELGQFLSVKTVNGKQFVVNSTNMSVFGTMTAQTLAATDKILTGMLSIGGTSNEITTVDGSTLKLQSGFGAGNIEAFNKKLVFTSEGGVISEDQITAKRFVASDDARGSIYATSNRIKVEKQWKNAPASITLTPEYRADVWVSDITKDGFYINAEPASASKKIFWWAVW